MMDEIISALTLFDDSNALDLSDEIIQTKLKFLSEQSNICVVESVDKAQPIIDCIERSGIVKSFAQTIKKLAKECLDFEDEATRKLYGGLRDFQIIICNTSERSVNLCHQLIAENYPEHALIILTHYKGSMNIFVQVLRVICDCMVISHNIIQRIPEARGVYREKGAVDILSAYNNSEIRSVKCRALLVLTRIADEAESGQLYSHMENIYIFIGILKNCMEGAPPRFHAPDNRYFLGEILQIINTISAVEKNKERLLGRGFLQELESILLKTPELDESMQTEILQIFWSLSFNAVFCDLFHQDPALKKLVSDRESGSHPMKQRVSASGIMWNVNKVTSLPSATSSSVSYSSSPCGQREVLQANRVNRFITITDNSSSPAPCRNSDNLMRKWPDPVEPVSPVITTSRISLSKTRDISTPEPRRKHIMLSYQHESRATIKLIYSRLQSKGYVVWVDFQDMAGSTLEAMADAVENSSVIVIALSQAYKNSPYCRSEAEYAYSMKKCIIPIRVEKRYKPEGWLGILIGTKLYYDFTTEQRVESNFPAFFKQLKTLDEESNNENIDTIDHVELAKTSNLNTIPETTSKFIQSHVVEKWSNSEVGEWLQQAGVDAKLVEVAFLDIDGLLLMELRRMMLSYPQCFYQELNALQFNLPNKLRLTRALHLISDTF